MKRFSVLLRGAAVILILAFLGVNRLTLAAPWRTPQWKVDQVEAFKQNPG